MSMLPLHHAVLSVADIDRSAAFYESLLGYHRTLESVVEGERYERYLRLPAGSTGRMMMLQADERTVGMIELIQWTPPLEQTTPPKRVGDPGITMLALELAPGETLDAVIERLGELGVPLWSEPETVELEAYPPFRTLIVEDPDGILIELIQLPTRDEVRAYRAALREQEAHA
jgi:catechol 2,3-dioxygenase-like lactoylglutathione lyase family enzyme